MTCLLNLNIPSLLVHVFLCSLVCFPCRYLTLALETTEVTSWRFQTPSPRIQWVLLRLPFQARGRSIPLPYSFPPYYAMFQTHTAMIPTSQQTIVLLSYRCSTTT